MERDELRFFVRRVLWVFLCYKSRPKGSHNSPKGAFHVAESQSFAHFFESLFIRL
jgi:hypothetical protein